jgi:hypothetical protein
MTRVRVAVARGNEKGRVERAIRYVRDNFFAGPKVCRSRRPQCPGRGLVPWPGGRSPLPRTRLVGSHEPIFEFLFGCDACSEPMKKIGDEFICQNHSGRPFTIPGFKHTKVMRSLRAREDIKPPSFRNF